MLKKFICVCLALALLSGCMSDREYQLRAKQLKNQANHPATYDLFTVEGPVKFELAENGTVVISGTGALIQCAWGNGPLCYETFRFLPDDGFIGLAAQDVRISEYRRVVVVSPEPLTQRDLTIAADQEVAGVVAPSMPSHLREFALGLTFPIVLTEGFGQRRPTDPPAERGLMMIMVRAGMAAEGHCSADPLLAAAPISCEDGTAEG